MIYLPIGVLCSPTSSFNLASNSKRNLEVANETEIDLGSYDSNKEIAFVASASISTSISISISMQLTRQILYVTHSKNKYFIQNFNSYETFWQVFGIQPTLHAEHCPINFHKTFHFDIKCYPHARTHARAISSTRFYKNCGISKFLWIISLLALQIGKCWKGYV